MKLPLLTLALAASLAACTQVPREELSDPQVAANGEPLECERVPIPGKIYPGKICMTEAQWAQHSNAGRDSTNDIQRRGLGTADPLSGG